MLVSQSFRLEPSRLPATDISRLFSTFAENNALSINAPDGGRIAIPAVLAHQLAKIFHFLSEGKTVAFIPEEEEVTTQVAADYLGVSRQYLVNLLDAGTLPCRKVGKHRRVAFRDLVAYDKSTRPGRRRAWDDLADSVAAAGLYAADYTGDGTDGAEGIPKTQ